MRSLRVYMACPLVSFLGIHSGYPNSAFASAPYASKTVWGLCWYNFFTFLWESVHAGNAIPMEILFFPKQFTVGFSLIRKKGWPRYALAASLGLSAMCPPCACFGRASKPCPPRVCLASAMCPCVCLCVPCPPCALCFVFALAAPPALVRHVSGVRLPCVRLAHAPFVFSHPKKWRWLVIPYSERLPLLALKQFFEWFPFTKLLCWAICVFRSAADGLFFFCRAFVRQENAILTSANGPFSSCKALVRPESVICVSHIRKNTDAALAFVAVALFDCFSLTRLL